MQRKLTIFIITRNQRFRDPEYSVASKSVTNRLSDRNSDQK